MVIIRINQESSLKSPKVKAALKGKSYLADTNFLLHWFAANELVNKTFELANKEGCLFFRNVTVHQELIDRLLKHIIGDKVYKHLWAHGLNYLIDGDRETREKKRLRIDDSKLKSIRGSNSKILKEATDELREQLKLFKDFPYLSAFQFEAGTKLKWEDAEELIFKYCLAPNDAMIANFALTPKVIDGLITCDNDFEHCEDFVNSKTKNLILVRI